VTGLLTGHCLLRLHESLMDVAEDSEYRGCLEGKQSLGRHVLMSCPSFSHARMRFLGLQMLLPKDIKDMPHQARGPYKGH